MTKTAGETSMLRVFIRECSRTAIAILLYAGTTTLALAGVTLSHMSIDGSAEPLHEPPPALFLQAIAQSSAIPDGVEPKYLASWDVRIDQASIQQPASMISLNLPGHDAVVVTLSHWEARSGYIDVEGVSVPDPDAAQSSFSWRWYGKAEQGYTIALTMEEGNLTGRIWAPGDVHYVIEPGANGMLLGITNSAFWTTHPIGWDETSHEKVVGELGQPDIASDSFLSPLAWDGTCSTPLPAGQPVRPVDVLVMYTPNLLLAPPNGYGSVAALRSAVQSALDDANQALRNVGILSYFYSLLGVEPADSANDYATKPITTALDLFSGITPSATAPYCTYPGNAYVAGRRTTMWADIVALARRDATGSNTCGVSRAQRHMELSGDCQRDPGSGFTPFAYMVFDPGCAADRLNFAHELGHLLGMEHDPNNAKSLSPPNKASCPWSFGHRRSDGSSRFHFRTVMAYPINYPGAGGQAGPPTCTTPSNCPQIDAYSDPLQEWDGANDGVNTPPFGLQPLGTLMGAWSVGDVTNPSWLDSHATDTLQRLAPIVSAFYPRPDLIFANGFD